MRVFFGQFKPQQNRTCQITGKRFGPTMPQKMGYKVTVEKNGNTYTYVVYGRQEAEQIRDNAEKGEL